MTTPPSPLDSTDGFVQCARFRMAYHLGWRSIVFLDHIVVSDPRLPPVTSPGGITSQTVLQVYSLPDRVEIRLEHSFIMRAVEFYQPGGHVQTLGPGAASEWLTPDTQNRLDTLYQKAWTRVGEDDWMQAVLTLFQCRLAADNTDRVQPARADFYELRGDTGGDAKVLRLGREHDEIVLEKTPSYPSRVRDIHVLQHLDTTDTDASRAAVEKHFGTHIADVALWFGRHRDERFT